MDTLVVPVHDGEMDPHTRKLKTKAIGQIFEVFSRSSFTVILDNGLMEMPPGDEDKPAETAMKILTSMWMSRLWTLQEAFLSKKRYVTFREESYSHNNLVNLEELKMRLESSRAQKSPVVNGVRKLLLQTILEKESQIVNDVSQNGWELSQRQAAMLVAGTWRAARWRVSDPFRHEILHVHLAVRPASFASTSIACFQVSESAGPKLSSSLQLFCSTIQRCAILTMPVHD
jgi:hypothetical protein